MCIIDLRFFFFFNGQDVISIFQTTKFIKATYVISPHFLVVHHYTLGLGVEYIYNKNMGLRIMA